MGIGKAAGSTGYYLEGDDGLVVNYGTALDFGDISRYHVSLDGGDLNKPIVGLAVKP